MKRVLSFCLALTVLLSSVSFGALSSFAATKGYAQDQLVSIQTQSGFIPGGTSAVQNNCYGFISKVCEKLFGKAYEGEQLYDNYKAKHATGNYYTVKTFTTASTSPTATDVENIISFFLDYAAPGDVIHYGAYNTSVSKTHTVMVQSIDSEKIGFFHSNYQIAQYGRSTCHVDYIYWDSFRKNPTQHIKNADGTLYSLNAMFYNTMKAQGKAGLGITINRYTKYEDKFYLVGAAVPIVKTERTSSTSIKLLWDTIINAQKYQVQYKKTTDTSYTTASASCTVTSWNVTGLTTGTKYDFRVRAYVGTKWFDYSDVVTKQVLPPTIANVKFTPASNGLEVKWAKRSDITGVKIYRADTADGTYKLKKTVTDNTVDTYNDTGVKYGTTYYYKLERYVTSDSKTYSTTSTAKSAAYTLKEPTVSAVNDNTTTVTFTLQANGCSDSFVYYLTDANGNNVIPKTTAAVQTLTVPELKTGSEYHLYVAQKTKKGTGEYTKCSVTARPAVVEVLTAKATTQGCHITFTTAEDVDGYSVWRSTAPYGYFILLANVQEGEYLDTTVAYNTTYYYKVRSFVNTDSGTCLCGYPPPSPAVKNTVGTVKGVTVTRTSPTAVKVKWNAASNANKYYVEYKAKDGKWVKCNAVKGKSKSISKLITGDKYIFRVRAANDIGDGAYSSKVEKKVTVPTPATPTAKRTDSGIRVYWKAKDYATGYKIYRASSKKGEFKLVKTITDKKKSAWTDTKVSSKKGYYYKIVCFKEKGKKTYNSPKSKAVYLR